MTGTSMDGIDISLIRTNGIKITRLEHNYFYEYSKETRHTLLDILNKNLNFNLERRKIFDEIITEEHYKALEKFNILDKCELIGFHGQTIFHDPNIKKTIQLGNPQKLATLVKKDIIFNFREKDLEHGGQGAPLAPLYHKIILEDLGLELPSCIINIGGISNISYWDGQDLFGFDTGPGNSLMDDYMRKKYNMFFDEHGIIASKGKPNVKIINKFLKNDFFKKKPPKSLDRNSFSSLYEELINENLSQFDTMATLAGFTIGSIAKSLKFLPKKIKNIIITGGGHKNTFLIKELSQLLNINIINQKEVNINFDFIESELIALLSARSVYNLPYTFPSTTGVFMPSSGGKRYFHL